MAWSVPLRLSRRCRFSQTLLRPETVCNPEGIGADSPS